MALPPLPENNTDRLFLTYTTGGGASAQEHTLSIRYNAALQSPGNIMQALADVLFDGSHQDAFFDGWRFLSAETQAAGSQVRLPVTLGAGLAAFVGAGQAAATPPEQAREVRLIGRGMVSGRRVSASLYGVANGTITQNDFRFTPGEGSALKDILDLARGQGESGSSWLAIDGGNTTWYTYVNWQFNSHWESEQRV